MNNKLIKKIPEELIKLQIKSRRFKSPIKGKLKFYNLGSNVEYDKNGKIKTENAQLLGEFKNILVETGRELLADIMVDDISLYTNGIYADYLAVGNDNTPATVDDWKLISEQQRANITAPNRERITGTSIAEYSVIIPSGGGTYTIYEAGLFLSVTEPVSDPQDVPAQRANTMITRAVESIGIPKNNADNLLVTYQLQF